MTLALLYHSIWKTAIENQSERLKVAFLFHVGKNYPISPLVHICLLRFPAINKLFGVFEGIPSILMVAFSAAKDTIFADSSFLACVTSLIKAIGSCLNCQEKLVISRDLYGMGNATHQSRPPANR